MAYRDLMHEIQMGDHFESVNDEEMFSILTESSAHSSEADFFDIKSTLTNYINQINNNTQSVHQYTDKYIISTSKQEYEEITQKIDEIISNNNSISTEIRTIINTEKNKIIATENNVENLQVIEFNNTVQNFKILTQSFQSALNSFDNSVRDKQMRQIYVLRGSIDEKEMDKLEELNYEQRQEWIEKQYQLTDDKTLERLIDLEKQRDGMLKIEKSINELKTLFEELNVLVIDQQMLIDAVAENVEKAKDDVESGVVHLKRAEDTQKRTRRWKCWCLLCLLVVIAVIILIVFLRSSG